MAAKWYVYELIDPRDNKVFYVGKGCGDRIKAHEREARNNKYTNFSKVEKIRNIWKSGNSVIRRKVACFWDEFSAYAHESFLMKQYQGLTNIKSGGSSVRKVSFFALIRDIIVDGKQEDVIRLKRLFPRHILPMDEHKQLYDVAVRRAN